LTRPRHEIARVSELLQAQLLQDININPVQPSLSVTNLNTIIAGGPARPGFNEFTPLFERNQAQLNFSGEVGSNYTFAHETVVSGLYDRFSISAGQFHYQTDGFRKNADVGKMFTICLRRLQLHRNLTSRRKYFADEPTKVTSGLTLTQIGFRRTATATWTKTSFVSVRASPPTKI
jgi:hypothetical protein